jgi:hypothetical protein
MISMGSNTSKFRLTQLALRAAVELERIRAGDQGRHEPLLALSQALLQTSGSDESSAPFRFVEPGFYQPLQRLYHEHESVRAADVEHIQALIRRVSEALAQAAQSGVGNIEALIRFCVALHQELIEELTAEDALVVHEGRTHGHGAAAGISAA